MWIAVAAGLIAQILRLTPQIGPAGIVGHAQCGDSAWLLSRSAELIRLRRNDSHPEVRKVSELTPESHFWGLACLTDGSLWTLRTGHELVRMTADGQIVEKHSMLLPQVQIFGVGERLVLFGLPVVANHPVLASSTRQKPADVHPWAGLIGRMGFGANPDLVINLVGCGLGRDRELPCWFSDADSLSVSDGVVARTVALPSLKRADVGRAAPIRDAALADGTIWVLAAAPTSVDGRRVGSRLIKANAAGVEQASIAPSSPARLILSADSATCVLLSVDGNLILLRDSTGDAR